MFYMLAFMQSVDYNSSMNSKHRKTLEAIFASPVNGGLEWARIESLLVAIGCEAREGKGSAAAFHKDGHILRVHRPHPGKDALRYRIIDARDFLQKIGVNP